MQPLIERRKFTNVLLLIITAIIVGFALKATKVVSMPLCIALIISTLFFPIHKWFYAHLPGWLKKLSIFLTMAIFLAGVGFFVFLLDSCVEVFIEKAPGYLDQIQEVKSNLISWGHKYDLPIQEILSQDSNNQFISSFASNTLHNVFSFLSFLSLIFFLVLLVLLETEEWDKKLRTVSEGQKNQIFNNTVVVIAKKIRFYFGIRTVVSLISGLLAWLWLWLMHVDMSFTWGVLFFLFNYIPNVGSIIASIPPILVSLLQHGFAWTSIVALGILVLEQTIGNYIDPRLQGKALEISPIVILISLIFWTWIWGVGGALFAETFTVALIIIMAHFDISKPIALLLSNSMDYEELQKDTHQL